MGRDKLQDFLNLLQCEWILPFLHSSASRIKKLSYSLVSNSRIYLPAQIDNGRVQVSLGFQLSQNVPSKLEITLFERVSGSLDSWAYARRIENLYRLVSKCLL